METNVIKIKWGEENGSHYGTFGKTRKSFSLSLLGTKNKQHQQKLELFSIEFQPSSS